MILEHARIQVISGHAEAFEAAFLQAATEVLPSAPGFLGATLRRLVEDPDVYMLLIEWETLEAHTESFRGSPLFTRWRELVGPHFAAPPEVVHSSLVSQNLPI